MTEFECCGESFNTKVPETIEYHRTFFVNGSVWLFTKKYHAQESVNWGHRVHCKGGYAVEFNVADKTWSEAVEVPALCTDEVCDEVFFVADNHVYILLINSHGSFNPRSLHKWCATDKKWIQAELNVDADCRESCEDNRTVSVGVADTLPSASSVHVISIVEDNIVVHKLDLQSGNLTKAFNVSHDAMLIPRGRPVGAVEKDNTLSFYYGVHGCGFRWEPSRIVQIDLGTTEAHEKEATGEPPKWGFIGPREHFLTSTGDWVMCGGSVQQGMCGSQASSDLYSVNLGSLEWKKAGNGAQIPEDCLGESLTAAFDQSSQTLYIVCNKCVKSVKL